MSKVAFKNAAEILRSRRAPVISAQGNWSRIFPSCHPEANFLIRHSTFNGIYEIRCTVCDRVFMRIEQ